MTQIPLDLLVDDTFRLSFEKYLNLFRYPSEQLSTPYRQGKFVRSAIRTPHRLCLSGHNASGQLATGSKFYPIVDLWILFICHRASDLATQRQSETINNAPIR